MYIVSIDADVVIQVQKELNIFILRILFYISQF